MQGRKTPLTFATQTATSALGASITQTATSVFDALGNSPRFTTFIFDLDGTLLDTLPDLVFITNKALETQGFPPRTSEEILSFVGDGANKLIERAALPNTQPETIANITQAWKDLYAKYDNTLTRPYSNMLKTLAKLKARGVGLGVLSNKFDAAVHQVINQFMPNTFDVLHGECEEIPRKPNPAGLLRTIKELNATPKNCVYVGDSPTDIEVAQLAGAYAVGVSWGYNAPEKLVEAGANILIESPFGLLKLA